MDAWPSQVCSAGRPESNRQPAPDKLCPWSRELGSTKIIKAQAKLHLKGMGWEAMPDEAKGGTDSDDLGTVVWILELGV